MQPVQKTQHSNELLGSAPIGQTVAMQIRADRHMFDMMVRQIYSDGPRTVVRELLSNAFDASNEVLVTLPTSIDPVFKVRDFGAGMSHDFVMGLYSVIGHSTKQNDNTKTGAFGVGSKSPLAITDTFTLRIHDADKTRIYTISISEAGVPQVTHMFDASRPNSQSGVEVSVPIKSAQINDIKQAFVTQAFNWFDKTIRFDGSLPPMPTFTKLHHGVYRSKATQSWTSSYFVRQGSATYPLDTSMANVSLSTLSDLFGQGDYYFDVPIGTFDATAARERIQYNPPSVANLRKIIHELCDNALEELKKSIDVNVPVKDFLAKTPLPFIDARRLYKHFYPQRWDMNTYVVTGSAIPGALLNKASVTESGKLRLSRGRFNRPDTFGDIHLHAGDTFVVCSRSDFESSVIPALPAFANTDSTVAFYRVGEKNIKAYATTKLRDDLEKFGITLLCEGVDFQVSRVKTPRINGVSVKRTEAPVFDLNRSSWSSAVAIDTTVDAYYIISDRNNHVSEGTVHDMWKFAIKLGVVADDAKLYRLAASRKDVVLRAVPTMIELKVAATKFLSSLPTSAFTPVDTPTSLFRDWNVSYNAKIVEPIFDKLAALDPTFAYARKLARSKSTVDVLATKQSDVMRLRGLFGFPTPFYANDPLVEDLTAFTKHMRKYDCIAMLASAFRNDPDLLTVTINGLIGEKHFTSAPVPATVTKFFNI